MFTSTEFDTLPYIIPNQDKTSAVADFVTAMEPIVMKSLLGTELYNSFLSGLNALPAVWDEGKSYNIDEKAIVGNDIWKSLTVDNVDHAPAEGTYWTLFESGNRWLRLKNGSEYLRYSKKNYWCGFDEALHPYMFSEYVRASFDANIGVGIVVNKSENATVISPASRIADAWNDYRRKIGHVCALKNSLYGFLMYEAEAGTYNDAVDLDAYNTFAQYVHENFNDPGNMNVFDI